MDDKQNYINTNVKEDIEKLYDHAKVANEEMSVIKVDVAEIKNDVNWLKRFFWVIATSSIGGLITGVLNMIWQR